MSYIVRQSYYMVNNKGNILIKQGLPLSNNALLFLRTDHNRIIKRLIPLFPRLLYTDLTTTWFLWSQWIVACQNKVVAIIIQRHVEEAGVVGAAIDWVQGCKCKFKSGRLQQKRLSPSFEKLKLVSHSHQEWRKWRNGVMDREEYVL